MSFRLIPKSVTLKDLERRNGLILRYSPNSVAFWAYYVKVHVVGNTPILSATEM